MRVNFSIAFSCVGSLVCCLWVSAAEDDSEKLSLADELLNAVLAEAQVVCVGQPMLLWGF